MAARTTLKSEFPVLREMTHHDLVDACSIERDCVEHDFLFEPASYGDLDRWQRQSEQVRFKRDRRLWVTMRILTNSGGFPIAYAVLRGVDRDADLRIVVRPDQRGRGHGQRLLESIVDVARDRHSVEMVEWIIHERHHLTLNFARECGFRPRSKSPVVRDWFGPFQDGFALQLRAASPRGC